MKNVELGEVDDIIGGKLENVKYNVFFMKDTSVYR